VISTVNDGHGAPTQSFQGTFAANITPAEPLRPWLRLPRPYAVAPVTADLTRQGPLIPTGDKPSPLGDRLNADLTGAADLRVYETSAGYYQNFRGQQDKYPRLGRSRRTAITTAG